MPKSKKPATQSSQKSLKAAKSASSSAAAGSRHIDPTSAKPPRPKLSGGESRSSRLKGISMVGTSNRLQTVSMKKATLTSATLHVLSPFVLTGLVLLVLFAFSWLFHFNFWDLFRPHTPPPDMEFALVTDTHAPPPKQPKFKGNFNQRAGGKQNPKHPLKATENTAAASHAAKATAPHQAEKATPPHPPQKAAPQHQPHPPQSHTPAKQSAAKPTFVPNIPMPSTSETPTKTQTAASNQAAASPESGAPSVSPIQILGNGNSVTGHGETDSEMGNPQNGDAAAPGVDVAQDADFGPFMSDLERRIKRNWVPPRGQESRKVLLLFYVARNGQVVKIETKRSSGETRVDQAAIDAVLASAPFLAFPPQVTEDVLPVEFTFDYNVLNPKTQSKP